MMRAVDDEADALYALPLEQFVPERAMLAKALRVEGHRDEAAAVAKLPKPSVAAWAVNQVVRTQPTLVAELWSAGDAVLAAQQRAVAGGGGGAELREALRRERAALDPLADAARGLMTSRGAFLGEANVQAVIETLHAAAVDPEARPEVAAGRAVRPLRLSGLEALAGAAGPLLAAAAPGAVREERRTATKRAEIGERDREDSEDERSRRVAAAVERKRRTELQRALTRAERERDAARARVAKTAAARDEAEGRIEAARAALEAAEAGLVRADDDRRAAHAALERAEDAVATARDALEG
jgi:hypothetical protein